MATKLYYGPRECGLSPATRQPQQAQEQVDEIEIQRQSAVDRRLASGVGAFVARRVHRFNALRIVRSQSRENNDSDDREYEARARAHDRWKEHGEHGEAHHSKQSHHAEGAYWTQVALGYQAESAEAGEAEGRYAEYLGNAGPGVSQKHAGKRESS